MKLNRMAADWTKQTMAQRAPTSGARIRTGGETLMEF